MDGGAKGRKVMAEGKVGVVLLVDEGVTSGRAVSGLKVSCGGEEKRGRGVVSMRKGRKMQVMEFG